MSFSRLGCLFIACILGYALCLLTLRFGLIEDSSASKNNRVSSDAFLVDNDQSMRVLYPDSYGVMCSIPLKVTRIESQASVTGVDNEDTWTFIIGNPQDAIWVYASPINNNSDSSTHQKQK